MNADIKRLWVDALRSGKYLQGRSVLRGRKDGQKKDRLCCLGVLCEVAIQEGLTIRVSPGTTLDDNPCTKYDGEHEWLPKSVRDWAELESCDPDIESEEGESLSALNDSGLSFKKIAKLIEENL